LARVTGYSFVSQRPDGAYIYHENARANLLARVKQDPNRFRELSRRAAEFFAPTLPLPRPFVTGEGEQERVFEWLYHRLAVDDEQAFDQLTDLYHQLEFRYNLAACGRLLALAQEQRDLLTGDRPHWLRYYQGRLLRYSQRWAEALTVLESLSQQELSIQLRSMLTNTLGLAYDSLGKWDEALLHYQASLDIKRALGDRQGESTTLMNIGNVYQLQGRWDEALAHYQASLNIFRALGDRQGESNSLMGIANVYQLQGRWNEALAHYQASLDILRALGDRHGEAITLGNIGETYLKQGAWAKAQPLLNQALQIARELGDRELEASTLHVIGEWNKHQGQWDEAIAHYNVALALRRELGAKVGLGETLDALGELYRMRGMWAEAVQVHEQALQIWRELAQAQSGQASNTAKMN